jgi:hypothetical protein
LSAPLVEVQVGYKLGANNYAAAAKSACTFLLRMGGSFH